MEGKLLYKDFIKDRRIYNLNTGFWVKKLQKILSLKISSKDFLYINKTRSGENLYDANPIFSYYDKEKNKAIRIIQDEVESLNEITKDELISAWLDKIVLDLDQGRLQEAEELVIALILTKESVDKCIEISTKWFNADLSKESIKEIIER